jgi:hypothetical protein
MVPGDRNLEGSPLSSPPREAQVPGPDVEMEAFRRNSAERGADVGNPALPTVPEPSAMSGREGDVGRRESDLSGDTSLEGPVSSISRDSSSRGDPAREGLPEASVDEETKIDHERTNGCRKDFRLDSDRREARNGRRKMSPRGLRGREGEHQGPTGHHSRTSSFLWGKYLSLLVESER